MESQIVKPFCKVIALMVTAWVIYRVNLPITNTKQTGIIFYNGVKFLRSLKWVFKIKPYIIAVCFGLILTVLILSSSTSAWHTTTILFLIICYLGLLLNITFFIKHMRARSYLFAMFTIFTGYFLGIDSIPLGVYTFQHQYKSIGKLIAQRENAQGFEIKIETTNGDEKIYQINHKSSNFKMFNQVYGKPYNYGYPEKKILCLKKSIPFVWSCYSYKSKSSPKYPIIIKPNDPSQKEELTRFIYFVFDGLNWLLLIIFIWLKYISKLL
jgi:hypothetical protein